MIAVDTNILVHAHRRDSDWHDIAFRCLANLASGNNSWAIPWPCLHEFFGIVTNPRIYKSATPAAVAIGQIDAWLEAPRLNLLSESATHWIELKTLLTAGRIVGGQVHDARIAALCLQHGVSELWTADRDFARYQSLKTRNPLVS